MTPGSWVTHSSMPALKMQVRSKPVQLTYIRGPSVLCEFPDVNGVVRMLNLSVAALTPTKRLSLVQG